MILSLHLVFQFRTGLGASHCVLRSMAAAVSSSNAAVVVVVVAKAVNRAMAYAANLMVFACLECLVF